MIIYSYYSVNMKKLRNVYTFFLMNIEMLLWKYKIILRKFLKIKINLQYLKYFKKIVIHLAIWSNTCKQISIFAKW